MPILLVILLVFSLTPIALYAEAGCDTVTDCYQQSIGDLKAAHAQMQALSQKAAGQAAKIEQLIAKYETALKTTQALVDHQYEAQLKSLEAKLGKAVHLKKATAELAESHRQSAKQADEQIDAFLAELNILAEKLLKPVGAVDVSNDGNVKTNSEPSDTHQIQLTEESAEKGEKIFHRKGCLACHTIGGGRLIGPDLKGVTSRREHSWLVHWIIEPDKMLAEGDPIATQLLSEYNDIPMPNLVVSEAQARDIIAYLATKTSPKLTNSSENLDLTQGEQVYKQTCFACHAVGIVGAPKFGDKASWAPRIAKGMDTLFKHTLEGFNLMPPKGGFLHLPDEDIKAAVAYMVSQAQ